LKLLTDANRPVSDFVPRFGRQPAEWAWRALGPMKAQGDQSCGVSLLYVLTGSHFCELARWALQLRGVPVRVVVLAPGPHLVQLRRLWPALRSSQLPVWHTGDAVLQGSEQILTHLGYPVQQAAAEALLNSHIGPLARQVFYAALSTNAPAAKAWMQEAYAPGPAWLAAAARRAPRWVAAALLRREGRQSAELPQLLHALANACASLSPLAAAEHAAWAASASPLLSRVALMSAALLGPVLVPPPAPWQRAPWSGVALVPLTDLQRLPLLQLAQAAWQARQAAAPVPAPRSRAVG